MLYGLEGAPYPSIFACFHYKTLLINGQAFIFIPYCTGQINKRRIIYLLYTSPFPDRNKKDLTFLISKSD